MPGTSGRPAKATPTIDEPGDDSPFALGLLLRRAHNRAAAQMAAAVQPLGLELRHFAVLIELVKHHPQTQRELADKVGRDTAGMVRVIDDLERAGYVVRQPVPGDRRLKAVDLTKEGSAAFDSAQDRGSELAADLTSHLTPADARKLLDLLTRFTYPQRSTRP